MNLFRRIRIFWRARFSGESSDAEAMLDEALLRLDEHLAEARGLLACSEEEDHRFVALMNDEQRVEERMRARAGQALQNGQDALAREAMTRALRARHQAQQHYRMWEQQQTAITRTRALLDELEEKRAEVERRRQQLLVRRHLARARKVITDTLYGGRNRWRIEQAEEEMLSEELTADSYQELALSSRYADPLAVPEITEGDPVELALQDLRAELQLPGPEEGGAGV